MIIPSNWTNDFFLQPPKSPFKKLFIGTRLGEVLQTMSFTKSIPKGLKLSECECGIGGKNSPIRYIPKSGAIQDALEKKKKVTYFKLILPSTGSEMSVAQWTSGTPKQFLLHIQAAIHACKQMELDVNFPRHKRQSQMQSMTWKLPRRLMHKCVAPRKRWQK